MFSKEKQFIDCLGLPLHNTPVLQKCLPKSSSTQCLALRSRALPAEIPHHKAPIFKTSCDSYVKSFVAPRVRIMCSYIYIYVHIHIVESHLSKNHEGDARHPLCTDLSSGKGGSSTPMSLEALDNSPKRFGQSSFLHSQWQRGV